MVVPELHFFQIEREVALRDAMELHEPLLRVAPKAFEAVDVDLAGGKDLPVIQPQVPIAAEHQAVIAPELIRVHDTAPAHLLQGPIEQTLRRDIGHDVDLHAPPSLQDTEDGHLAGGAPSALALAPAAEVGLIQLDLALEQSWGGVRHERLPEHVAGLQRGRVAQADFAPDPARRDLQLKELDDPQPLDRADLAPAQPPPGPVAEGVATAFAPVAQPHGLVDAVAPATCAAFAPVFPHLFAQELPGLALGLNPSVKRIGRYHDTSLTLVSNV